MEGFFQEELKAIKMWNQSIIQDETNRIKEILKKNYDYNLRSIITMLIVLQFRIFSAIRTGGPKEEEVEDATPVDLSTIEVEKKGKKEEEGESVPETPEKAEPKPEK